ncbi:MAG: porin family protein [Pseudolabrys sp.]|nr:porin family protein [Pseudolabrys sp.]
MRRLRIMLRGLAIGAAVAAMPAGGAAAGGWLDAPLRGSLFDGYALWEGFYVGGHASYVSGGADFSNVTQSVVADALRNTSLDSTFGISSWSLLGKSDSNGSGFGGFLGYNWQWDDVVLGLEANYTKADWSAVSANSVSAQMTSGTTTHDVTVDARSSIKLIDYASLRGRAGYATGHFLPYGLIGFVVGRADIATSATITDTQTDNSASPPTVTTVVNQASDNRSDKFIYGYSIGAGLDVALAPNVFVRGEYERIQFFGLGGLSLYLNNIRGGLAVRF